MAAAALLQSVINPQKWTTPGALGGVSGADEHQSDEPDAGVTNDPRMEAQRLG